MRCTRRPSCSLRLPRSPARVSSSRSRALSGDTGALPRWTAWLAIVGVVANVGAVFGTLSLTGPLNSGNGIVGGIAAPVGVYLLWIFSVSLWWLIEQKRMRPPKPCRVCVCSGEN